uniref:Uncharacterized protein n=1 Tax=Arundo donax TaxID=35708 RepID=A0A0A9C7H4_ARUDO
MRNFLCRSIHMCIAVAHFLFQHEIHNYVHEKLCLKHLKCQMVSSVSTFGKLETNCIISFITFFMSTATAYN